MTKVQRQPQNAGLKYVFIQPSPLVNIAQTGKAGIYDGSRGEPSIEGDEMRLYFILGMLGILLSGNAEAQSTERVRMRQLTSAENTSLDELYLTTPAPPYCVKWTVAIIAKEVPINFPGLPRIEAFEQTTLVFDPGPENSPTEATAVFTWPAGTIDPSTGGVRQPTRIAGMLYRTAYGNAIFLFNVDSVLTPLRQGTLQFHVELQPRAQPQFDIQPAVFRDGTAWCYFDSRIGPEYIAVSARADGTHALAVRGGVPAAAGAVVAQAPAAGTASINTTTNNGANAGPRCTTCGH